MTWGERLRSGAAAWRCMKGTCKVCKCETAHSVCRCLPFPRLRFLGTETQPGDEMQSWEQLGAEPLTRCRSSLRATCPLTFSFQRTQNPIPRYHHPPSSRRIRKSGAPTSVQFIPRPMIHDASSHPAFQTAFYRRLRSR